MILVSFTWLCPCPCPWLWLWESSFLSRSIILTSLLTCIPLTISCLKFSLSISISLLLCSKHISSWSLDCSLSISRKSPPSPFKVSSLELSDSLSATVLSLLNLSKALCYLPLKKRSIPYESLILWRIARTSISFENLSLHLLRTFWRLKQLRF